MLGSKAGGECWRQCEAIILREGDIFNIQSDKLGHRTGIRSDLTTSAKGLLSFDQSLTTFSTIIVNWIKHGGGCWTVNWDSETFFWNIGGISVLKTAGTITSTLLLFLHMVAKSSTVHSWQFPTIMLVFNQHPSSLQPIVRHLHGWPDSRTYLEGNWSFANKWSLASDKIFGHTSGGSAQLEMFSLINVSYSLLSRAHSWLSQDRTENTVVMVVLSSSTSRYFFQWFGVKHLEFLGL